MCILEFAPNVTVSKFLGAASAQSLMPEGFTTVTVELGEESAAGMIVTFTLGMGVWLFIIQPRFKLFHVASNLEKGRLPLAIPSASNGLSSYMESKESVASLQQPHPIRPNPKIKRPTPKASSADSSWAKMNKIIEAKNRVCVFFSGVVGGMSERVLVGGRWRKSALTHE